MQTSKHNSLDTQNIKMKYSCHGVPVFRKFISLYWNPEFESRILQEDNCGGAMSAFLFFSGFSSFSNFILTALSTFQFHPHAMSFHILIYSFSYHPLPHSRLGKVVWFGAPFVNSLLQSMRNNLRQLPALTFSRKSGRNLRGWDLTVEGNEEPYLWQPVRALCMSVSATKY